MHRENLKKLLNSYDRQRDVRDRFLAFVNEHSICFERTNTFGHITSSSWLLSNDGKRVLLTHHKKLNKWLQPGGHCDGDSDVRRSALREAVEESGIKDWEFVDRGIFDLDVHRIPARKQDPEHFHFDVRFLFRAVGNEEYLVSDESHDLAWVDLSSLEKYTTEESVVRMAAKCLR